MHFTLTSVRPETPCLLILAKAGTQYAIHLHK